MSTQSGHFERCCGETPSDRQCPHGRWIWKPREVLAVALLCFGIGVLLVCGVIA